MVGVKDPQTTPTIQIQYGGGRLVLHAEKGRWQVVFSGMHNGALVNVVLVDEWHSGASETVHPDVALAVAGNFAQAGVMIVPVHHRWCHVDG